MKTRTIAAHLLGVALAYGALAPLPAAAVTNEYSVAHVKTRNTNMVFVVINPRFFRGNNNQQAKWYTDIQSCVRSVNLAGETVIVATVDGRFHFYGPKAWRDYLRTLDMEWVRPRINKKLTCNF